MAFVALIERIGMLKHLEASIGAVCDLLAWVPPRLVSFA